MNYEYTKAEKEFLEALESKQIKCIYFVDSVLLANPDSGDFDSIVIEFNDCYYVLKNVFLGFSEDDGALTKFDIKKVNGNAFDFENEYRIETFDKTINFVRPLIDEYNNFNALEFEWNSKYLFIISGEFEIIATFCQDEYLALELFEGIDETELKLLDEFPDDYINFFESKI